MLKNRNLTPCDMYIKLKYTNIYIPHKWSQLANYNSPYCHMLLRKYSCHTAQTYSSALVTVVHIKNPHYCTKSQESTTGTFIYHAFAICLPAKNIPIKCQIYATCANYSMCINGGSMQIYMPHMKSLESKQPKRLLKYHW